MRLNKEIVEKVNTVLETIEGTFMGVTSMSFETSDKSVVEIMYDEGTVELRYTPARMELVEDVQSKNVFG